jgi:hypothetical protein
MKQRADVKPPRSDGGTAGIGEGLAKSATRCLSLLFEAESLISCLGSK